MLNNSLSLSLSHTHTMIHTQAHYLLVMGRITVLVNNPEMEALGIFNSLLCQNLGIPFLRYGLEISPKFCFDSKVCASITSFKDDCFIQSEVMYSSISPHTTFLNPHSNVHSIYVIFSISFCFFIAFLLFFIFLFQFFIFIFINNRLCCTFLTTRFGSDIVNVRYIFIRDHT